MAPSSEDISEEDVDVADSNYDVDSGSDDGSNPLAMAIKEQLRISLGHLHGNGSFATSDVVRCPVNPGISIKGVGSIGLPLSRHDARVIIERSHQAPYGRGTATVVDTNVRKTWELDTDQFDVENPKWQGMLRQTLDQVVKDLGLDSAPCTITANLYKMLLYEEGAMFKPHKDSEKAPGMFGTLVFCLPSMHEGGDVRVVHNGQTRVLSTAQTSRFDYSYLAWYADVTHEVEPVTSGYRLVLTYNLIRASGNTVFGANHSHERMELSGVIARWKDCYESTRNCPRLLAYVLQHKYTEACLSSKQMKGPDQLRVQHLDDVCAEHGFCVYLALLERTISGDCQDMEADQWQELYWDAMAGNADHVHAIEEVQEEELRLSRVVDLDGHDLVGGVLFDESCLIQADPFDEYPDHEEWSGPTGNEGVSATHFYRKTVAVLMPRGYRIRFLFDACKAVSQDMGHILKGLLDESADLADPSVTQELQRLCQMVMTEAHASSRGYQPWYNRVQHSADFWDEQLGRVFEVSIRLQDLALGKSAFGPAKHLRPWIYPALANGVGTFGFSKMLKLLDRTMSSHKTIHQTQQALDQILSSYQTLPSEKSNESDRSALEAWKKVKIQKALTGANVSTEDAKALIKIVAEYKTEFFYQSVLPCVKRNVADIGFYTAFAIRLLEADQETMIGTEATIDIFRDLVSGLIPILTFDDPSEEANKRPKLDEPARFPVAKAEELASMLHQCMKLNLPHEVDQILARLDSIKDASPDFTTKIFPDLLCPFLGNTARNIWGGWTAADHEALAKISAEVLEKFRSFAQSVLQEFISRHVGPKPMEPVEPGTPQLGPCPKSCQDCEQLQQFLGQDRLNISFASTDRMHLEHLTSRLPKGTDESTGMVAYATEITDKITLEEVEFSLKIRKVDGRTKLAIRKWDQRRQDAERWLNRIDYSDRPKLLGDKYDEIFRPLKTR